MKNGICFAEVSSSVMKITKNFTPTFVGNYYQITTIFIRLPVNRINNVYIHSISHRLYRKMYTHWPILKCTYNLYCIKFKTSFLQAVKILLDTVIAKNLKLIRHKHKLIERQNILHIWRFQNLIIYVGNLIDRIVHTSDVLNFCSISVAFKFYWKK